MTFNPTPEQIEARNAALAEWQAGNELHQYSEFFMSFEDGYNAALVAAAGAAPQELSDSESEALKAAAQPYAHTFHRDGKAGLYVQIRNLPRIVAELRGGAQ